jgi:ADP-heptose:LPS heptosyltransferase
MKNPKKIIVVDFGGVGDLVLSIPFLRGLKKTFPSSEVSMLCAQRAGMILKEQSYIDRLFLSPIAPFGLFKTGLQLRKKRFDMAINLMPETSYFSAIKMYLLLRVINARQWVGRNTEGRGLFYDIKVPEQEMQKENEVLFYGKMLKAISIGTFDERLEFYISKNNRKRAGDLLSKERNSPKNPFVLISPGSDWPSKRWPIERYAQLVKKLEESFPYLEFGVIGTQKEMELANVIKEKCGEKIFVLSGKTPLEVLPAIVKEATLLITNDSGPAHIGRAVGTPSIILAGPSESAYLTVKGKEESIVIQHRVSCAPCMRYSCDSQDCWKAISVQEVLQVTSKILERKMNEDNS